MTPEQKLQTLRAIDKYDRLGADGVRLLLTTGRLDESGAWTAGVGLTENQADLILYGIGISGRSNQQTIMKLHRMFTVMSMSDEQIQQMEAAITKLNAWLEKQEIAL